MGAGRRPQEGAFPGGLGLGARGPTAAETWLTAFTSQAHFSVKRAGAQKGEILKRELCRVQRNGLHPLGSTFTSRGDEALANFLTIQNRTKTHLSSGSP